MGLENGFEWNFSIKQKSWFSSFSFTLPFFAAIYSGLIVIKRFEFYFPYSLLAFETEIPFLRCIHQRVGKYCASLTFFLPDITVLSAKDKLIAVTPIQVSADFHICIEPLANGGCASFLQNDVASERE